jgi:hypothetical protein
MERVARFPARERSELFSETATQKGTTPAVVEKDFWVAWVLNRLFQESDLTRLLMFKGGTSLSKVYRGWRPSPAADAARASRGGAKHGFAGGRSGWRAEGGVLF